MLVPTQWYLGMGPSPCLFSLLRFPTRLRHGLSTLWIAVSIGRSRGSSVAYSPVDDVSCRVSSYWACVFALQVIEQSLGMLLSSHQDINLVYSIVLFMVERLGAPAVVAFWFMDHPAFWKSSGRHRPQESDGSGRMRMLRRSRSVRTHFLQ